MKLDYDLMRDIMFTLEDMDYTDILSHENYTSYPRLRNRNVYEVLYTIQRMQEGGLIIYGAVSRVKSERPFFRVACLTWQGHQYLETLRVDSVWSQVLQKVSIGLPLDSAIASVAKLISGIP